MTNRHLCFFLFQKMIYKKYNSVKTIKKIVLLIIKIGGYLIRRAKQWKIQHLLEDEVFVKKSS